ncbi:MAG: MBL fold metallo-hydrolase [Ilumatobacteraceae bacterium]
MALTPYTCANCGFWQRWFEVPPSCPVCTDVRNNLPEDGWDFVRPAGMLERVRCSWHDHGDGLVEFRTSPRFGLDSVGWLLQRPDGNIAFEAAGWYDEAALAEIERLGGIAVAAASHPHAYGALWLLQNRFGADVAITRADHGWTKAFRVTRPYDDTHELAPGLTLHRTGGHFDGHAVLFDEGRRTLFSGDAVKFDARSDGRAFAVSCHKAWHQATPLTHGELRRYRDVLAPLEFDTVCSPFALARGATTSAVVALLDAQQDGQPTVEPMEVSG